MGQRLAIEVKRNENENPICVLYYQWSGYTKDAVEECSSLIQNCFANLKISSMTDDEILKEIIDFAQNNYNLGYKNIQTEEMLKTANIPDFAKDIYQTHGGVCAEDLDEAIKRFGTDFIIKEKVSNSNGIVIFSDKGMERAVKIAEMFAEIVLTDCTVSGEFVFEVDEDFVDEYEEPIILMQPNDLAYLMCRSELSYDDLISLNEYLKERETPLPFFFQLVENGTIYESIS